MPQGVLTKQRVWRAVLLQERVSKRKLNSDYSSLTGADRISPGCREDGQGFLGGLFYLASVIDVFVHPVFSTVVIWRLRLIIHFSIVKPPLPSLLILVTNGPA
jgi:hypothetical protein